MDAVALIQIARTEMARNGLDGWTFNLDRSKSRFGQCNSTRRSITMSRALIEANTEERCMKTVIHEIAHALVGAEHGHDNVWKAKARELGHDGNTKYSRRNTVVLPKKFIGTCQTCDTKFLRDRRSHGAGCSRCTTRTSHALITWAYNDKQLMH